MADTATTISAVTKKDGSTVVVKRRNTRSWKTEAQNWERSYLNLVRWELWAVGIAAALSFLAGWLVGAWVG